MRRSKMNKSGYRGQALVEFALILPVLLILTLMIIQYGLIFYTSNSITNLSREGARFAATAPQSDADIEQHIEDVMPPNISYSDIKNNITILPKESSSSRQVSDTASGGLISVSITYPMKNKLFLPSTVFGFHIFKQNYTSTTQMMVE